MIIYGLMNARHYWPNGLRKHLVTGGYMGDVKRATKVGIILSQSQLLFCQH